MWFVVKRFSHFCFVRLELGQVLLRDLQVLYEIHEIGAFASVVIFFKEINMMHSECLPCIHAPIILFLLCT